MRHQAQLLHRGSRSKSFEQLRRGSRREAEAIHAGVDLQPRGAAAADGALEHFDLGDIVHDQFEFLVEREPQFLVCRNAREQHDGLVDARFAQQQGFRKPCNGERVGRFEVQGYGNQPVAIGIGLDDRHDPCAWHRALQDVEIVS